MKPAIKFALLIIFMNVPVYPPVLVLGKTRYQFQLSSSAEIYILSATYNRIALRTLGRYGKVFCRTIKPKFDA